MQLQSKRPQLQAWDTPPSLVNSKKMYQFWKDRKKDETVIHLLAQVYNFYKYNDIYDYKLFWFFWLIKVNFPQSYKLVFYHCLGP